LFNATQLTSFLLIRHAAHCLGSGKLAGRMPGVHLSARGIAQADRLAQRLRGLPLSAIYCSPLERAQQTAEALSLRFGIPIKICEALNEVDFGEWTGKSLDELRGDELFKAWNEFRSGVSPPGGEHSLHIQYRIVGEMLTLQKAHPGGCIALITHGDLIKRAVAYWLGVNNDLAKRIEIGLASVSAVAIGELGPWVLCINNREEVMIWE
jgi:broad specificity phosphatase PhoE